MDLGPHRTQTIGQRRSIEHLISVEVLTDQSRTPSRRALVSVLAIGRKPGIALDGLTGEAGVDRLEVATLFAADKEGPAVGVEGHAEQERLESVPGEGGVLGIGPGEQRIVTPTPRTAQGHRGRPHRDLQFEVRIARMKWPEHRLTGPEPDSEEPHCQSPPSPSPRDRPPPGEAAPAGNGCQDRHAAVNPFDEPEGVGQNKGRRAATRDSPAPP